MIKEGEILWTPPAGWPPARHLQDFMAWVRQRHSVEIVDYESLRLWSVAESELFWRAVWDWAEIWSETPYKQAIDQQGEMINTRWFAGARVNYAEHVLRAGHEDDIAFSHESELRPAATLTRGDLRAAVRRLATSLRAMGVQPGDVVASYMPNIVETGIAMLAATAIGAVWSSAAPEFGVRMIIDRFSQIAPKVLFAVDGYRYGGKNFDRRAEVKEIAAALPSLKNIVFLPYLIENEPDLDLPGLVLWADLFALPAVAAESFAFERVESNAPLWVVFSSGTTGVPKAILHSHGGMLAEHIKAVHFHLGLYSGACLLFYSTTGWMMWNILIGALLSGAAAILYDGHPTYPHVGRLFELADHHKATCFGASPSLVQIMQKMNLRPGQIYDLTKLEAVILSGSPASPECFAWFYQEVKEELWVTSQSGGTEIASAFVGGVPLLPVRAGEIQARCLGMDVHAWNQAGEDVVDTTGELVVLQPFPSMPLKFCNDPDNRRYHDAYFNMFPGVWRHGDFIRINEHGGCFITGRSDATLNRFGVRIGTAEIYRTVEGLEGIEDSLVVCCEWPDGGFFMPLFVRLKPGRKLDEQVRGQIQQHLRQSCSPRHVPDAMIAVPAIPYTVTGKKMELPVRRLLMGEVAHKVASRDAMANPDSLDWFIENATALATRRENF